MMMVVIVMVMMARVVMIALISQELNLSLLCNELSLPSIVFLFLNEPVFFHAEKRPFDGKRSTKSSLSPERRKTEKLADKPNKPLDLNERGKRRYIYLKTYLRGQKISYFMGL